MADIHKIINRGQTLKITIACLSATNAIEQELIKG